MMISQSKATSPLTHGFTVPSSLRPSDKLMLYFDERQSGRTTTNGANVQFEKNDKTSVHNRNPNLDLAWS